MLRELGRFPDAAAELRKAIELDPEDGFLHALLALDLASANQLDEALATGRRAVELDPESEFTHYSVAQCHIARNEWAEALPCIDEAIRLDPRDASNHMLRATILGSLKRWPESEASARRALELDPQNDAASDALAEALSRLGRVEDAKALVRGRLSQNAENDMAHRQMGFIALNAGDRSEAIAHFREALRIDPESSAARSGLALAIRSRDRIYGAFLRFSFWLSDRKQWLVWAFLLAVLVSPMLLRRLDPTSVPLQMFAELLRSGLLIVFGLWCLVPVFGLLALWSDRDGRGLMTRAELHCARWHAALLLSLLGLIMLSFAIAPLYAIQSLFGVAALALSVHHLFAAQSPAETRVLKLIAIVVWALVLPVLASWPTMRFFPLDWLPSTLLIAIGAVWLFARMLLMVAILLAAFGDDLARWIAGTRDRGDVF